MTLILSGVDSGRMEFLLPYGCTHADVEELKTSLIQYTGVEEVTLNITRDRLIVKSNTGKLQGSARDNALCDIHDALSKEMLDKKRQLERSLSFSG